MRRILKLEIVKGSVGYATRNFPRRKTLGNVIKSIQSYFSDYHEQHLGRKGGRPCYAGCHFFATVF